MKGHNMTTPFGPQVDKLVSDFESRFADDLELLSLAASPLQQAARSVQETWSGSFIGWHGRMYFGDFEVPTLHERFSGEWGGIHGIPPGWSERTGDEVRQRIDTLAGLGPSATEVDTTCDRIREGLDDLHRDIIVLLDTEPALQAGKAVDYASGIREMGVGTPRVHHINRNLPKSNMSRDTEALRQGTCLASWLYYEAVGVEAKKLVDWFAEFKKSLRRLIQLVERNSQDDNVASMTQYALHPTILEKCGSLYGAKQYAEAVEKGFKTVRDRLRSLTGHETGSEAFGKGRLHVKGAAAPNVDVDFNEAVKFLTMSIDRFRNEKSHTSNARIDDPARAYQYLVLSSLAMYLLDGAEVQSQ